MENQKNCRIAFILGSMKRGGAERVVSILSNYYAEKGWEVDILLLLSGDCEYKLNNSIRIIPLATPNTSRISQLPTWIVGVRSYLKKYRPNTVLAFAARINIISAIAGMGIKKNFIVSERNDPSSDGRSIFVRIATNIIYQHVDKVVFQTKWAQSCFKQKVKQNSVVIYNPVNVIQERLMSKSKKIVAVGRLEKQKNHALLIRAFSNIHKKFPEYELHIFGEGSLRESLEELVKNLKLEKVVFLPGKIEDVHEQIADAEMFILPSDYEGLSNALLEAMMMGIPCISTNCAGSNEVIQNGENGILTPIGDEKKLTEAMEKLIVSHVFALELGMKAKQTSELFSSNSVLFEWASVLDN